MNLIFTQSGRLQHHLRIQIGEKPNKCDTYTDWSFTTASMKHTGEHPNKYDRSFTTASKSTYGREAQ